MLHIGITDITFGELAIGYANQSKFKLDRLGSLKRILCDNDCIAR